MNLSKKGWLAEYLKAKKTEYDSGITLLNVSKGNHPDEALYHLIQPSGIMYGYPVKSLENNANEDQESRVKLLLMDVLLSSFVLQKKNVDQSKSSFEIVSNEALGYIGEFYNKVYSEVKTSKTSIFGQRRTDVELVEKILDKRIKKIKTSNFWLMFFHNSLLFLDIYFFRQWVQASFEQSVADFLVMKKEELTDTVVKVMAAAAHANKSIEKEEEKLFNYFIDSLSLSSAKRKQALSYLENIVTVDDIELPPDYSWIVRKYLIELAILTAWADRKVEDSEFRFLQEFNEKLNFSEDDFENSLIAVEGFVLDYWDEIDQLQDKQDFLTVSDRYIKRIEKIIDKNQDRLKYEVLKNKKLQSLIKEGTVENLHNGQKELLKEELINCIETLPAFEIISLPRNFLKLSTLMKILPGNFFKEINIS